MDGVDTASGRRTQRRPPLQQLRALGLLLSSLLLLPSCIRGQLDVTAAAEPAELQQQQPAQLQQIRQQLLQQQQQQQQPSFMRVQLTGVTTSVENRYSWTVTTQADTPSTTVPVNSQVGWPQVRYTVSYTRNRNPQTVYVLSGSVLISNDDRLATAVYLPNITVTTASGDQYRMPEDALSCPTLVVPAGSAINCSFAAGYAGPQPLPGSVTAAVSLAGTLLPITITSPAEQYDFTGAVMVRTGAFATASNYFEMGPGIMQPYGVYGEQPPPGLRLEDNRVFKFIAVFGSLTSASCGSTAWRAVNTAELTPSAPAGTVSPPRMKTSQASLDILLSGCQSGPTAPGFTEQQPQAPPAPVAQTPGLPPPAAPVAAPTPQPTPDVPGVEFAEAGSTLCGRGVCPKGQRCFDGWNCCPTNTPVCGGQCCQAPNTCVSNRCVPPGATPCGATFCAAGETCSPGGVCCTAASVPCGKTCCQAGQDCVLNTCAAPGSQPCGTTVCAATQTCVSGICCAAGETACGGRCCPATNTCLQGQFCVPAGSTMCNGQICSLPQTCAGGMVCCDTGASFCGGACCAAGNTCQGNVCLLPGQQICGVGGGLVCSGGQTCLGGVVCCDQGATLCNNACCPSGQQCINNQCVASGSTACGGTAVCPPNQICGNTQTGLCCQSIQQFGCGNQCCNSLTQVCNQFTQTCTERFNSACGAGQIWCAQANMCCPVGQVCTFGQCVAARAIGKRRLQQQAAAWS